MPTTTKTKTTEATRATNTKRADELFKKGQAIVKGESPTGKESLRVHPATSEKSSEVQPNAAPVRIHNPERYAAFVEAEREAVNSRLEEYFEGFIKDGLAEEKNFLVEVFSWWESGFGHGAVRSYGEREIPLFSAIQDRLNGMHLVQVESEEMVREVEEFITAKLEAGWKAKPRPTYRPESDEAIKERLRILLTRQVQYFSMRCKRADLIFMIDMLEQWEALTDNAEFWAKTEKPLAAAAELHLTVSKRRDKESAALYGRLAEQAAS